MPEQGDQRVVRLACFGDRRLHQRCADALSCRARLDADRAEPERLVLLDVGLAERDVADDRVVVGGDERDDEVAGGPQLVDDLGLHGRGAEGGALERVDGGFIAGLLGADVTARRCVARGEHDRLALAGGERDRELGVVGGELGGRDRQAAERSRERERGARQVIDRAQRRGQLAAVDVDVDRGRRCRADLRQRLGLRRNRGRGRDEGDGFALGDRDVGVLVGLDHRRSRRSPRRAGRRASRSRAPGRRAASPPPRCGGRGP